MAAAMGPDGSEAHLRAIVFRDGDMFVAQCLEYDIATQARDIDALLDRLDLTVEAEFAACEESGRNAREIVPPAPNYYHDLWENRSISLHRVKIPAPTGGLVVECALARAA